VVQIAELLTRGINLLSKANTKYT